MANMTVANRIKDRRNELGWSQRELASKMGYASNTTITKIEQGTVDVSQDRLEQFANVLGVSVAYLIGFEQIQKKNDQLVKLVIRMRHDDKFAEAVKMLDELDADKYENVLQILTAFTQK
jgi:transcriptional regulator with XRE-family HTH domain